MQKSFNWIKRETKAKRIVQLRIRKNVCICQRQNRTKLMSNNFTWELLYCQNNNTNYANDNIEWK